MDSVKDDVLVLKLDLGAGLKGYWIESADMQMDGSVICRLAEVPPEPPKPRVCHHAVTHMVPIPNDPGWQHWVCHDCGHVMTAWELGDLL